MSEHISFPNIVNIKNTFMYFLNKMGKTDPRFFEQYEKSFRYGPMSGVVLNLDKNIIILQQDDQNDLHFEIDTIIVLEFNDINDNYIIYSQDVTYAEEDDDEYCSVYNVKDWKLVKSREKFKERCKKCHDYYKFIKNMTVYEYYKTIEHDYFIREPIYNYYKNKYTPQNSFELIKTCFMLYPLINFLSENKILFDLAHHYILRYEQPVIILGDCKKNKFVLIDTTAFEESENKIIDLTFDTLNNNIYEQYIAYYNNHKVKISKTMSLNILIDKMLQNDYYASLILNNLRFFNKN